jgi:pimeloyl-ACP methyl ester carboxylesterase
MPRVARPLFALTLALLAAGCATTQRPADPLAAARAELHAAGQKHSLALYLDAAKHSLPLATSDAISSATRAEAVAIYDRAVSQAAILLFAEKTPSAPGYAISFTPPPRGVTNLIAASDISRKHLEADIRRPGFGGPLVAVMDGPDTAGPNRPPKGYAVPTTAVADFTPTHTGQTAATIRFLDPRQNDAVRLAGAQRPLAGDFTAPLAYYPHPNELIFGFLAMLRSDLSVKRSALMFYEPYDPKKIPVLFVHGLMSSPHAWLQVANQLEANPEFRRRYQIWAYFYPTGAPIAGNALQLRMALAAAATRYHLGDNLVIVGHSMGGILTRMQVTNPGRALWNAIFRDKADQIYNELPADSVLKRALIFRANPHVARVVFFSVPHRGSDLANLRISAIAARFIRMPITLVKTFNKQLVGIMQQVDPSLRSIPTSIQGLSPRSRLLIALAKLPITVPCDTVVGNRGKPGPLAESSDGVVPYWSSHVDFAKSELVVPTGHDSFDHPASVANLERILGVSRTPAPKQAPAQ